MATTRTPAKRTPAKRTPAKGTGRRATSTSATSNTRADQPPAADEAAAAPAHQYQQGELVTHTYHDGRTGRDVTRHGIVVGRVVEPAVYEDGRPVIDRDTGEEIELDRPRVAWLDEVSDPIGDDELAPAPESAQEPGQR